MSRGGIALELRDATVKSGDYSILDKANAVFLEGEASFIMGTAGSGKSSLLKTAAGLLVPDSGSVMFRGKDMRDFGHLDELEFRRLASFAFQDNALWANQSVLWNLTLPLRVHRPEIDEKAAERIAYGIAETLGYYESLSHRPAELSIGEQHVISIGRALILDPDILFLDQPLSHLDDSARDRFADIVATLKDKGKTLVVVTNSAEFAMRFHDRLFVMSLGSVAATGSIDDVYASPDPDVRQIVSRLRAARASAGAPLPAPDPAPESVQSPETVKDAPLSAIPENPPTDVRSTGEDGSSPNDAPTEKEMT